MATMNVSLPAPMKQWIENQIGTGHYSNVSDYVRSLVRQDQEYQTKVIALRQALAAGEESGVAENSVLDIWQKVKSGSGPDV